MQLSAYSDYSLRVLMYTALRHPQRVTVDEVAGAFGISRNHLVKIVHDLGRNGYLATKRGIGGGFTLAQSPDKICVGGVVRLGEESQTVIDCQDRKKHVCCLLPACRLKGVLDEAAAAFFAVLDGYVLADLLKRPSDLKRCLDLAA